MTTHLEGTESPDTVFELTYGEQLARLIMAEPKGLCVGELINAEGIRCAVEVVNWQHGQAAAIEFIERYYAYYRTLPQTSNDNFRGTKKARQLYMAEKVRVLT